MSSLIAWAKSNPMSLVAILIVLLSLVLLFAVNLMGKQFVDEMAAREGELNQIKELSLTPVTLPPANVDDPPQKLRVDVRQTRSRAQADRKTDRRRESRTA